MDQLTVDFAVLTNLADSITDHIDATTEKVDEVDQVVTDLAATWTGEAHDAFHDAVTEWSSAARDLRDRLHWIRGIVTTTHDNHASAVRTNVTIWRG